MQKLSYNLRQTKITYRCSSSIANFRDKLHKRLGLEVWHWWRNRNDRVIFVGLYHRRDYIRFIWHRGPKKVFWCGSDILVLKHSWWRFVIRNIKAEEHYCENPVEWRVLGEMGISTLIRPMIFDDPLKFNITFKSSDLPRVFASYHKGREEEYAPVKHPQITYLNGYSEQQFDERIKDYQGAIRFNKFDGFAETLAKSVLMGQYPISQIYYPYCIGLDKGLKKALEYLASMKEPNYIGRKYWLKVFEESLYQLKEVW